MKDIIDNKEKYPAHAFDEAQKWMKLYKKYENAKAWPNKLPRSITAKTATQKMKEFLNEADLFWGSNFDFKYIFALLRAGANPNISNDQGINLLGATIFLAIMWNKPTYIRNIQNLLRYGANPNIKTSIPANEAWSSYPLTLAIGIGYSFDQGSGRRNLTNRILDVLLKNGAKVKHKGDPSDYLAMILLSKGSSDEFERFILHGANIDEVSYGKMTPLQQAVTFKNVTAVKILLHHGADVYSKGMISETPLELAKSKYTSKEKTPDEIEIIKLLEQANIKK